MDKRPIPLDYSKPTGKTGRQVLFDLLLAAFIFAAFVIHFIMTSR